ncbi:MAG: hypothetical protein JST12_18915 [Armatimonadetes bacterium]|nr:hypothetical protein [Armatimonadota bacterium]MBS1703743.1 hypothetical protein [Armatimonadota bacterium]
MAYRSWLKDVRRLDDLSKYCHFFPNNHREWDREWKLEMNLAEDIWSAPIAVEPAMERYFRGALHDGHVLGLSRSKDQIEFSISNMELEMFVRDYDGETGIERDTGHSPVRLRFEGVNYANAVRPDPDGWLKWDDWTNWQSDADAFAWCWFHQQDGKTQWIGVFRKYVEGRMKQSGDLFVLIDCESVSAWPESERALRKRIGDECYDAWLYVNSLPPDEVWLTMGHLRRYLDAKGIPRRHIPHQSER